MAYTINYGKYSSNFAVPQELLDGDFCSLNEIYLKVILLIFKNSSKNYSANLISNLLGVEEKIVKEAISYWIEKEFLITEDTTKEEIKPEVVILSKKTISQSLHKPESGELSYLLECMENQLKRPVTSVEYKTIVHILEYIKLPADVIIMAIQHCISIDKANARYIEKVCATWADRGITTHEKAEQYLNLLEQSHQNEGKVASVFGIKDRALADGEREAILRWFNEYKADIDMIKLAFEKTVMSIGKLSFPYIDKILLSWHEKGYKAVCEVTSDGKIKKPAAASYDIDEIDKYWDTVPKLV